MHEVGLGCATLHNFDDACKRTMRFHGTQGAAGLHSVAHALACHWRFLKTHVLLKGALWVSCVKVARCLVWACLLFFVAAAALADVYAAWVTLLGLLAVLVLLRVL